MEVIKSYIAGQFIETDSDFRIDVFNPGTGDIYGQIIESSISDVNNAVDSAREIFSYWAGIGIDKRCQFLLDFSNEIKSRLGEFAEMETRDTGKPITLSKSVDIPRSIENFKFFSEHTKNFTFSSELNYGTSKNRILNSPLGVVGCISPWNLPLYLFTWKIAPALAAGNTVVAKPSEIAPYTAYMLGEICNKISLPPGVLNILQGRGSSVGNQMVRHKDIKAISFTGGTSTGRVIYKNSAGSFKKLSLEMGGKNPAIVFADSDYQSTLDNIVTSSFSNQGQICLCSSRIIIEKKIYEKFRYDFCEKISHLKIGDPANEKTEYGAISSKEHLNKIIRYISIAKDEGARILHGGDEIILQGGCKHGYFFSPTVLEGLSQSSRLSQEEIFGPVVCLYSFETEQEAVSRANDSNYGLSATIWTSDQEKASRVSNEINAGVIWINSWMIRDLRTPFGGTKHSGLGREGGDYILEFFTEKKNICYPYETKV